MGPWGRFYCHGLTLMPACISSLGKSGQNSLAKEILIHVLNIQPIITIYDTNHEIMPIYVFSHEI